MCVCLGYTDGFLFYQKFSPCAKGTRLAGVPPSPAAVSARVDSLLPRAPALGRYQKSRQRGAGLTLVKTNQPFFKTTLWPKP